MASLCKGPPSLLQALGEIALRPARCHWPRTSSPDVGDSAVTHFSMERGDFRGRSGKRRAQMKPAPVAG